jgi:hypothetical protein
VLLPPRACRPRPRPRPRGVAILCRRRGMERGLAHRAYRARKHLSKPSLIILSELLGNLTLAVTGCRNWKAGARWVGRSE